MPEIELFGWSLSRKKEEADKKETQSPIPPNNNDGAIHIPAGGGVYGMTSIDMDGSVRTEAELVTKYRNVSLDPVVDLAIQDIVNEAIVEDVDDETVKLLLDDVPASEDIKNKIREEFDGVLRLVEFQKYCYELFRRWYIDGRLFYHVIISKDAKDSAVNTKKGILELRYIDPRHIKKVKEIEKKKDPRTGVVLEKVKEEYYVYSPSGFLKKTGSVSDVIAQGIQKQGLKLTKDSVVYCTSGYMSPNGDMIYSYLHKAIRPLNQLRSMEDSIIIYRISRAPERRIFYVDVGDLPKAKAEQYLTNIMNKFKNKVVYDSSTGEIRDSRKFMTMLEDFWLPRRDGSRGTQIDTLPAGQNLGEIEDVRYFKNILYNSLNVPITRLESDSTYTLGRATEVSRDEVKFAKFISRLRKKFSELFTKLLERQLILKGVCTPEDWKEWEDFIKYEFAVDNYFEELKYLEINRDRVNMMRDMEEFIGKYYSHEYIRKNVLRFTDEEINEIDGQISREDHSDFSDSGEELPAPVPATTKPPKGEKKKTKAPDTKEQESEDKEE